MEISVVRRLLFLAACAMCALPEAHAQTERHSETPTGAVVTGEVLIRFSGEVSWHDAQLFVGRTGGTVLEHGAQTGYYRVYYPEPGAALVAAPTLEGHPRVYESVLNHVVSGTGIGTSPTAPLQQYQWNLNALRIDPFDAAPRAHGVTVAVLDTGVAYENFEDASGRYAVAPDLAGVEFVPGFDFINNDAHANDDQRHGTHVTAVIAATSGTTPIARGVTIMPVKVLGSGNAGTELALAEGIRFAADNGADVINMSLAFPPSYFPSRLLQEAIDHAARKGVIMVAASGNDAAEIVAYPAAFRDVIAVGASALPPDFQAGRRNPWKHAFPALVPAPYQNHGFKLDVLAPSGTIDGDANGDGFPEAVLAQTFRPGQPTEFGYAFYAGTSQSAAQVSGLVAVLKARDPRLDAATARARLTESAAEIDDFLSEEAGRGRADAKALLRRHDDDDDDDCHHRDRPRTFADPIVTLHDRGGHTVARAQVEILGEDGRPERLAFVFGTFTGAAFEPRVAFTGWDGVAHFQSQPVDGAVVAFQVDAVVAWDHGVVFDRPQGFIRIDAVSLAMLAAFGEGIGTSPTGIGTSPTAADSDDGIGTSPTLVPSDVIVAPLTIGYDPALFAGTGYRRTLLLPNFSWALAIAPMAVAVDEQWFLTSFPAEAQRRAISFGRGFGRSPFLFDSRSFPKPVPTPDGDRLPLIVLTYTSGIGTSPTGIGTSPTGIGTSPTGIGTSPTGIVVDGFSGLMDGRAAAAMTQTLAAWYVHAAGLGDAPTWDPRHMTLRTFEQLHQLFQGYVGFAPLDVAAPVAAYGSALAASGTSLAPGGDGGGSGELQLP